jgi:lipoyl(octanoyl) transferase
MTLPFSTRLGTNIGPEWWVAEDLVPYEAAIAAMQARVAAIHAGQAEETIWLLEHAALFTAGTSARDSDLFNPGNFPTHRAGRGGQWTYHGPGQRVGYVMLDLRTRGQDVRAFVHGLETWLIAALARLGVRAETREGRVGLWVPERRPGVLSREAKIGAIGVRVTRWVTWHGFALNVAPDLSHYGGIVPCGISDAGVTSLEALGHTASLAEVDSALMAAFAATLGAAQTVAA